MELLNLEQFKKAYPYLSKKIYEVLNIEYPEDIKVPIDMEDASLADTFFARYEFDKSISFGKKKAKMIIDLARSQPQMEKWLDILYPDSHEVKVKVKHRRKRQVILDEIILDVYKDGDIYRCKDSDGKDFTDEVGHQGKLAYAYINGSVIRGRLIQGEKKYCWRGVKKKFVEKPAATLEEIEQELINNK